jgi:DNA-binding GntR family transcriptional regulator
MNTATDIPATSITQTPIAELLAGVEVDANGSMASQIHALIWDLIVTVRLKPGQLLSEKEVAELLGASKTPVREAFIRLEDKGLVKIVPKSGTYVTPIQINRFIEACFVRLRLESGIVRRAAERNSDFESLIRLEACVREQEAAWEAEDYIRFFQLDEKFHRSLFDMAGLPGVWGILKQLQSELYRLRHLKRINRIRRGEQVIAEHKAILEAIRDGNPDAAEEALIAHLGSLSREIEELAAHPKLLEFIDNLNGPEGRAYSRTQASRRFG